MTFMSFCCSYLGSLISYGHLMVTWGPDNLKWPYSHVRWLVMAVGWVSLSLSVTLKNASLGFLTWYSQRQEQKLQGLLISRLRFPRYFHYILLVKANEKRNHFVKESCKAGWEEHMAIFYSVLRPLPFLPCVHFLTDFIHSFGLLSFDTPSIIP